MSKKERKKELFIKTSNKIKTPNIFVNGYERKDVNGEKSQRNKLEKSKNGRFFLSRLFSIIFISYFCFLFTCGTLGSGDCKPKPAPINDIYNAYI